MTAKELEELQPQEKRIKLAVLCGWVIRSFGPYNLICPNSYPFVGGHGDSWGDPKPGVPVEMLNNRFTDYSHIIPRDFLHDLNAMHEAEQLLKRDMNGLWYPYVRALHKKTHGLGEGATAAQRADTFLMVVEAPLVVGANSAECATCGNWWPASAPVCPGCGVVRDDPQQNRD